jgi:uncharacterized protein YkwD
MKKIAFILLLVISTIKVNAQYFSADSIRLVMVELVNEYRIKNGVGKLENLPELDKAAEKHCRYLLYYYDTTKIDSEQKFYITHAETDKKNPFYAGYMPWDRGRISAENIAVGCERYRWNSCRQIAVEIFEALKKSPGHNANMLNPEHKYFGFGYFDVTSKGSYKYPATMVRTVSTQVFSNRK